MKKFFLNNENFIKSYQYYAFPLEVLACDNLSYTHWMLGRFINIYCDEVLQFDELAYDDWNIVNDNLYKTLTIDTLKSIIISSLDNNQAFHLWEVNEKYIPNTNAYEKYDCTHDLLVLGYDKNDTVLIMNYNASRQLSSQIIPLYCLQNSLTQYSQGRAFSFTKEKIQILSNDIILSNIQNYISPPKKNELTYYNKERNFYNHAVTGIGAIEKFSQKLKVDFSNIDYLNSLCLINEHMISTFNALLYLSDQNVISHSVTKDYNKIKEASQLIQFKFLKNLIKQSSQFEYDILVNIQHIIHQESLILSSIFK